MIRSFITPWARVRRCLFLSPGLARVFRPPNYTQGDVNDMLTETDGAKVYRRNTLALASVLVLARLAGADPGDLSVFGVKPDGDWGVIVISAAAIVTQLYWYILRYLHNMEDAEVEHEGTPIRRSKIRVNDGLFLNSPLTKSALDTSGLV